MKEGDTLGGWYPPTTNFTNEVSDTKKSLEERERLARLKAQQDTLQKREEFDLFKGGKT